MKIRIAICDDEPAFIEEVQSYIQQFSRDYDIYIDTLEFHNGEKLLQYFETFRDLTIVLLDIKMEKIDGLCTAALIRQIDVKVKIIFLTAFTSYAIEGYHYDAMRYLVKPVGYDVFSKELADVLSSIRQEEMAYYLEKTDAGLFKIYYDKIIYIETYGRNTLIHAQGSTIVSYRNMRKHEKNLDNRFCRTHISFIINMAYIDHVQKFDVFLSDGSVVPISKNRKSEVSKRIAQYYGRLM